jgi:hypothetical protein
MKCDEFRIQSNGDLLCGPDEKRLKKVGTVSRPPRLSALQKEHIDRWREGKAQASSVSDIFLIDFHGSEEYRNPFDVQVLFVVPKESTDAQQIVRSGLEQLKADLDEQLEEIHRRDLRRVGVDDVEVALKHRMEEMDFSVREIAREVRRVREGSGVVVFYLSFFVYYMDLTPFLEATLEAIERAGLMEFVSGPEEV